MKCLSALSAIAILGLVGCETTTGPLSGSGFDPLGSPGAQISTTTPAATTFKGGQFVRAAMDNTAFFKARPSGSADADKLLTRNTSMKVISESDSYLKVELDSGEIGFVPSVMVEDPNAVATPQTTATGEYQIYPPLPVTGVGEPLPVIGTNELPPDSSIPTIIDPNAPPSTVPVPPVLPQTENFAAPVTPEKKE